MEKLIKNIKENSISHGSLPFWSWNDKLTEKELREQIRNMHDLKMNGFFMHARCGLETKYLSKEWFKAIKISIDEAKKLGMEAWSYDENGWPSGFADGILLKDPDNHALYLEHAFFDDFPMYEDALAIYAIKGTSRPILTDVAIDGAERYLVVYQRADSSYVDTMRADITDKFIKETHALYKKKLGEDFGTAMPGFFTDEPQYYRYATPFSKMMDTWFMQEYGYSVFDALPAIFMDFDGYESYLYDYHKMTHTKFINNFIKRIYDWAHENGIKITGHAVEEFGLAWQMNCIGSIMPFYEYEDMPGIDYLGRDHLSQLGGRQLGSACEQLGKKKALTETFACCGWDVTPAELKSIAELQYAGGANVMCQHLYPFSERGQRKRDYPAHYSPHSTWQDKMGDFNTYFNNLGYTLSLGKQDANVLVIHPIHSAWLTYRRHINFDSVKTLEDNFYELFTKLAEHQIPYHFGEESLMKKYAKVEGDKIRVGECIYDTVILPKTDTIDDNTYRLLIEFTSNNGKLLAYKSHLPNRIDGKPVAKSAFNFLKKVANLDYGTTFKKLCDDQSYILKKNGKNIPEVLCMVRNTEEYGKIYYLTNIKNKQIKNTVFSVKTSKNLCCLDMMTLEIKPLRAKILGEKTDILLDFEPNSSFVIVEGDIPYLPFVPAEKERFIKLKGTYKLEKKPENILTLDRAALSCNGVDFTEERPIERIRDNLLFERYKGDIWLKFTFNTDFIPKKLDFVCEKPNTIDLAVNGNKIEFGRKIWFDNYFKRTNIAKHVLVGKNEVVLHMSYYQNDYVYHVLYGNVMESLRNCLNFDTEIEATYLVGDFAVETESDKFIAVDSLAQRYSGKFVLTKQTRKIDAFDLVHSGYPFFSGTMELSKSYNYKPGAPTVLKLDGRFQICDLFVNGCHTGAMMFTNKIDLKPYLLEGKNKLTLKLTTNRRNTLGPHHARWAEPAWVSPTTFTFEGQWKGGECEDFNPDYSFIRFGIN